MGVVAIRFFAGARPTSAGGVWGVLAFPIVAIAIGSVVLWLDSTVGVVIRVEPDRVSYRLTCCLGWRERACTCDAVGAVRWSGFKSVQVFDPRGMSIGRMGVPTLRVHRWTVAEIARAVRVEFGF